MPRSSTAARAALFACLLVFVAAPAAAQLSGSQGAVFRTAEPGHQTLTLQLWGDVRAPGLYIVREDTDLLRLLTLAGGPAVPGDRPRQRANVDVSISRNDGAGRRSVFRAPLAELADGITALPELRDGDVVQVETSVREVFHWRDVAALISTAGTLTLLFLRISDRL